MNTQLTQEHNPAPQFTGTVMTLQQASSFRLLGAVSVAREVQAVAQELANGEFLDDPMAAGMYGQLQGALGALLDAVTKEVAA